MRFEAGFPNSSSKSKYVKLNNRFNILIPRYKNMNKMDYLKAILANSNNNNQ